MTRFAIHGDDPTPAEIDAAERVLLGWNVHSPRERLREVTRQALVAARALDPLRNLDAPTIGIGVESGLTGRER